MKNLPQRIASVISHSKKSPSGFALSVGVSHTMIRKTLQGESKPGSELLEIIVDKYPEISAEWLIRGEGEMLRTAPPKSDGFAEDVVKRIEAMFRESLRDKDETIRSLSETVRNLSASRNFRKATPQRPFFTALRV